MTILVTLLAVFLAVGRIDCTVKDAGIDFHFKGLLVNGK